MRDIKNKLVAITVLFLILILTGAITAIIVWMWQNAADKRQCRRSGGAVVETDHAEWHCVCATPETR